MTKTCKKHQKDLVPIYNKCPACEIEMYRAEKNKYKKALEEIGPMCGNPDAVDSCRLILNKCQEALEDEKK